MLHLRRTISLLAAVGLMAQAVALERHTRAMLGAALLPQLGADLARICHGGADTAPTPPRAPDDFDLACPICSSLGSALIEVASAHDPGAPARASAEAGRNAGRTPPRLSLLLRPPVRAPPRLNA
jgi:hypothetical protein